MAYERTCVECADAFEYCDVWDDEDEAQSCRYFTQRPATADELRAELRGRCEALDGLAQSARGTLRLGERWYTIALIEYRKAAFCQVPCIHRYGDEGIE